MTIIILVGVIGVLLGVLIGKRDSVGPAPAPVSVANSFAPADDGKLAKEYKEQVIVKTIRENAKDLQKCYFELLAGKPEVSEGEITILFKVEEDGSISSAKATRNEFANVDFENCVTEKMKSYYLTPPPYGINRNISHVLAFKSEETALKEAKERELKNKPPKMLPVRP